MRLLRVPRAEQELVRRALTQEEIARESEILIDQGHKRILLVAGESYPEAKGFNYILKAIETIYQRPKRPRRDPPGERERRAADGGSSSS